MWPTLEGVLVECKNSTANQMVARIKKINNLTNHNCHGEVDFGGHTWSKLNMAKIPLIKSPCVSSIMQK